MDPLWNLIGKRIVSDALNTFEASRAEKLQRLKELQIDPWGGRFDDHRPIREIRALDPEAEPPHQVRAAGRILQRRVQGKVHFVDIWDWTGRIQVYLGQKQIGELGWKITQNLDLGDLIGVDGILKKTRTGELTIFADKLTFLTKSLEPHPDKWGGMQDIEYRLRHRYLDLIYTPETLDRALKRVKIIRTIRNFLDNEGYLEVETPVLHAIAGGAAARPFVTHHNALNIQLYQRIALELHLKRLLVGGLEKVYEIGRVFRNEGISPKHNPEFTMLELYQAYGDYHTMMDLTENLIVAVVRELLPDANAPLKLPYGQGEIDFTPPWQRASYAELFQQHIGVAMDDRVGVEQAARKHGIVTTGKDHDVLVHELFEECVEDKLQGPVFVYDYPAGLCPLTKRKRDAEHIAERFELYIQGMELANAYTELNDPITQEQTFRTQLAGLPEEESMARMDEDFVRALRYGMPPAGGLGIGIDRLVMLLTNTQTIRDVILFPLLRPEK
ncbi:MAG: lysine--tRNA ligase [Gemmatales bacterium]|nr:MAG: lysine--tRNA ligase [Gemmatales bacterium]